MEVGNAGVKRGRACSGEGSGVKIAFSTPTLPMVFFGGPAKPTITSGPTAAFLGTIGKTVRHGETRREWEGKQSAKSRTHKVFPDISPVCPPYIYHMHHGRGRHYENTPFEEPFDRKKCLITVVWRYTLDVAVAFHQTLFPSQFRLVLYQFCKIQDERGCNACQLSVKCSFVNFLFKQLNNLLSAW